MARIFFLVPGFRPTGGVVKVFDYAAHARDLGYEPVICCHQPFRADLPVLRLERFASLTPEQGVRYLKGFGFEVAGPDRVFFSWPGHYDRVAGRLAPGAASDRVIHIVQNTRHGNPQWLEGLATRLLALPMARIMITHEVHRACLPHLNPASPTRVILEGHNWPYFSRERRGGLPRPIKVAYTTWKSRAGLELEEALAGDARFAFRAIHGTVAWPELRDLYHWCDVFLGFPNPQEGFYLVGLEAMAAGALFVTPDVEGNRAYCRWGENCLPADFNSVASYRAALERLAAMGDAEVEAMRAAGYAVLPNHTLEAERRGFGEFLKELGE